VFSGIRWNGKGPATAGTRKTREGKGSQKQFSTSARLGNEGGRGGGGVTDYGPAFMFVWGVMGQQKRGSKNAGNDRKTKKLPIKKFGVSKTLKKKKKGTPKGRPREDGGSRSLSQL